MESKGCEMQIIKKHLHVTLGVFLDIQHLSYLSMCPVSACLKYCRPDTNISPLDTDFMIQN